MTRPLWMQDAAPVFLPNQPVRPDELVGRHWLHGSPVACACGVMPRLTFTLK